MNEDASAVKSPRETILTVTNRHSDSCGTPPKLELGSHYTCYFENSHGEQAIIQYDREKKQCRLWMGDVGWETLEVVEFRGQPIARFLRSKTEQATDFKKPPQDGREEDTRTNYALIRKFFGKPKLTDGECEFVSNAIILSQPELRVIMALWQMWNQ